ncbi:MAG: hypothetical protein PUG66_03080 [Clostridiales bacterium]|nr:hypothetical protein [Clostridiales bacterium]
MAIEPKIKLGSNTEKKYTANKEFTDRKYYKEQFYNEIKEIQLEKEDENLRYHVLNFYGIGGIGKSSLQKELCNEIDSNSSIIYAQSDLANAYNRNSNFLLGLAQHFMNKKILFYHFGLAYAIYFKKTHRDTILANREHSIVNDDLGFVAEILSTIDGLGIIGVIPGVINRIYNVAYNKLHLDAEVEEDLQKMEVMSASQCEKLLPAFFAYDLNKYLKKETKKIIVIFLDTYEALWNQIKNDITKFSQDQFVRELISQLPGVLFVISSREYLDWKLIDSDWDCYIKQYEIKSLEDTDVNLFLVNCGIKELDIRNKMQLISMGVPYHLDILVDTYIEMKNKNITPRVEMFANNAREILECFFKFLQEEEISVIKIISIPRFYTFDLFKHLLLNFPTGYSITMFDEFNKFSFISTIDNRTFHIHEIMRRDVIEIMSNEMLQEINKNIAEYYFSIYNNSSIYTDKKISIKECVYHSKYYLSRHNFVDFLLSNVLAFFVELQYKGESSYLYDVLSDVFSYISYSDCVELYEIYTDMIMLNGNFKEAVENIDLFLKKYTIEQISTNSSILQLYVKKIKHQMVYMPLNDTIIAINSIKSFIDYTDFSHQYVELLYTEGNMLLEQGKFPESQKYFDDVMKLSDQYDFIDMKCRTLRKMADYFLIINNVYEAKKLCSTGLNFAEENNLIRYGNYLKCTNAEIYRKLKLFEQSKSLYIHCQEKFSELGIQPWIAHTELGLAMIDLEQENYSALCERLDLAKKIYTKHCHTWGLIHTELIHLQTEFLQKGYFSQNIYDDLYYKCRKYNYDYLLQILEKLAHNECVTTSLMFL